jgi:hypothetical protein
VGIGVAAKISGALISPCLHAILRSLNAQAVTLLHELGHAIGFLFGNAATAVKPDTELTNEGRAQSAANTKLIREKCNLK